MCKEAAEPCETAAATPLAPSVGVCMLSQSNQQLRKANGLQESNKSCSGKTREAPLKSGMLSVPKTSPCCAGVPLHWLQLA